jgi:hypothetical protein
VRVSHDEGVLGGPDDCPGAEMRGVVATGALLVAAGDCSRGGATSSEEHSSRDAMVWWSIDGIRWSRRPADESVFGGPEAQEIDQLVVVDGSVVGCGWGDDTSGACWVSPPPD